ncbi:MAG: sugar transferase [Anaerovoracaceae bacterium]|jgi:sugar transferase EpsL
MKYVIKRFFDIFFSLFFIVILSPILLIVCLLVRIKLGSPIFFRQKRPGLHGKVFTMFKFRSMIDKKDAEGNLLPDTDRLTRLGKFLRSTSIDELPELYNILKGDMSFVGPRPLLVKYLERYSPEQARRHEVKPGLTGWAQVNGRNAISWEEKFKLDVWYVDNWNLMLDIKILWMTVIKVFKREGISAEGEATMCEFTGSTGDDK